MYLLMWLWCHNLVGFFLCFKMDMLWGYGLLYNMSNGHYLSIYLFFVINLRKGSFLYFFLDIQKLEFHYCRFVFYGITILTNSLSYLIWYLEQTVTTKVYLVFIPKTFVILWNLKFLSKYSLQSIFSILIWYISYLLLLEVSIS